MKALVTGGAGFIGSFAVKELLKSGFDVILIDKLDYSGDLRRLEDVLNRVEFFRLDLLDFENLRKVIHDRKPHLVIHFAGQTHVDRSILFPKAFIENNIIGTFNLLEVLREVRVDKFIHISTDEVYGEVLEGSFFEHSPLLPNSPYAFSKASSDLLVRVYYKTYGIPSIILRPTNNYGPWQYPEKLIPLTILKALNDEKIPIYGSGNQRRTWLFVEDFCKALKIVIDKGKVGEIYNVGSDEEYENLEVVKKILIYLNKPFELIEFVPDRPSHDFRYALNYDKIRELGYLPSYPLDEGLKITVDWYLKNTSWLNEKYKFINDFVKKLIESYKKQSV